MSEVIAASPVVAPNAAHQSRWGWHPCDQRTFLLLKAIHKACWKAVRQHAAWHRWNRKAPHNRVERRRIRDAAGRVVGRELIGPLPEPPLCPTFVKRETRPLKWHGGKWHAEGVPVEFVELSGLVGAIITDYRNARTPKASPADVRPLWLHPAQLDDLAAQLGVTSPTP